MVRSQTDPSFPQLMSDFLLPITVSPSLVTWSPYEAITLPKQFIERLDTSHNPLHEGDTLEIRYFNT